MAVEKIILVTGANTGLGFQTVRAICSSHNAYHIIIGSRSLDKAQQAIKDLQAEFQSTSSRMSPLQIDLEDNSSIEAAFKEVQSQIGKLDVLINNAGAQFDQQLAAGKMNMRTLWNRTWDVNVTGTQIVTTTFVPLLLQSADPRLLFVTSGTSSLTTTENPKAPINSVPEKGWPKTNAAVADVPAYRSAKTGMNMMMREWHRNLKADGVKVWCISPGYLATGLGAGSEANKNQGAGDPVVAGMFVKEVLEGKRDEDVGKVILKDNVVQPW